MQLLLDQHTYCSRQNLILQKSIYHTDYLPLWQPAKSNVMRIQEPRGQALTQPGHYQKHLHNQLQCMTHVEP